MQGIIWRKGILWACSLAGLLLLRSEPALGQSRGSDAANTLQNPAQAIDLAAVGPLLHQLQSQVQELDAQIKTLRQQQESAQAESAVLRAELEATKSQFAALSTQPGSVTASSVSPPGTQPQSSSNDRLSRLEDNQQLADARIAEQSQTKVESASKYRLRLNGIVLFNTFVNRGTVENQDFPLLAIPKDTLSSDGSFGASLRQSQIGIQGFGPTVAGARTSADIQFDFAGGFPQTTNGVSFGVVRLRTGTIRFDWNNTSLIAGQDTLFIAPLSPTSVATLAVPAMAYSGNLWSWTPQIRAEHRFTISDGSSFLLQGGILDSLSGEVPSLGTYREASWGESSGQPAYAARISWTKLIRGQNMTFGVGGYYGRQYWGLNRSIDGWAGTLDLLLPLTSKLDFTGQFYRGKATGGLSGGVGQSVLWNGSLLDPETDLYGLNSLGGWAQLKFKATSKLQLNGAFGLDNPYANDLRQFGDNSRYYSVPISKNYTSLLNFLYQPRSDIVLSLEYRRLKTFNLDSKADAANIVNLSVGYIF